MVIKYLIALEDFYFYHPTRQKN